MNLPSCSDHLFYFCSGVYSVPEDGVVWALRQCIPLGTGADT